jgi:hypothetical protein
MESEPPTILSNDDYQLRNAVSYINSVAIMRNDDLDDTLDGINSFDLTKHITSFKNLKGTTEDIRALCDKIIALNNNAYTNRFQDYHTIFKVLTALRDGCQELIVTL